MSQVENAHKKQLFKLEHASGCGYRGAGARPEPIFDQWNFTSINLSY